ncbi:uncharacterized protein Hap1MRO34_006835 isoform 1-T1 [Clarias gariepinus]|uniref:zinc finger protein 665-like isoform X1 n=1 Tax=Clarias gariepinus TaxID=13013 RepID=UPI00234C07E6|nr:zinc finger protein 665-like isoform X1 [Clarias gariepinus]
MLYNPGSLLVFALIRRRVRHLGQGNTLLDLSTRNGTSDVTMANTLGTVPLSADPVSIRMKSKNSEEKLNETDKNLSESRVYIGAASSRWRELRDRSHFRTDAELALFLLDWYENQPLTFTPSQIVPDRPRRLHPPSAGAEPVNDQADMTSEAVIKYLSRKTPPPDPPPSQVYEDVKTETSDGGTSEVTEVCVKKEETLELDIHKYQENLDHTPEKICFKEEDADHKDHMYCEVCKSVFFNKCEVHGPPLFIPDTPVPMGVSDRARLTLPPGLEIQKSSIPDAGLGVFNKGETVPVGAHFGPYQGELVDREEAKNSRYSWVIYWSRQCEEYIDATRETESNWMRYVNCARNNKEQNLVAFQYRGGILYRCCRPINPGQELLVWYEEEYAKELSPAFDYLWNKKSSTNELNTSLLQSFSCSTCFLSYASQIYLHKHIQRCHYEEYMRLQESGEIINELQISSKGCSSLQILSDTLSSDTSPNNMQKEIHRCLVCGESFSHENAFRTHQCIHGVEKPHQCSECGDRFTHQRYLHRHQWIHKGEKPYRCSECKKSFTSQLHLQLHQRIHTGERPFQCSQCGRGFTQKSILKKHQRIHNGEKPFQCSQCGETFALKSHLQKHQRSHAGENVYRCTACEKSFTYQSDLQQHQRIHTGEKPYQCSQCGKSFSQRGYLNYHLRLHAGDKPHQCAQCGKRFIYQSALKVHQRIHAGERPYQCLQCGKSFTVLSGLQIHQRIHTGERPYLCAQCGKSFYHSSALKVHQRIHTGEKPYHCSQCGKSYTEKRTLEKHQQRFHTAEKPYPCSKCEKKFSSLSGLRTHQRSHTDATPYHCSQCGNGFTEKRALQKHQLLHTREKPYHCSECEKRFSSLSSFRTHQRLHTEGKPYHCSQSEKSFHHSTALKVHQHVHTGEKPHQCSQCGKGFTEKRALQNHQRVHTGEKPYPCSDCEKRFISLSSLINHQHLHTDGKPYLCSKCGKGFAQKKSLIKHVRCHGRKKPKPRS